MYLRLQMPLSKLLKISGNADWQKKLLKIKTIICARAYLVLVHDTRRQLGETLWLKHHRPQKKWELKPRLHRNTDAACENDANVRCRRIPEARQTAFGCATNIWGTAEWYPSRYIKGNSHTIHLCRVDSLPRRMPNNLQIYPHKRTHRFRMPLSRSDVNPP